VRVQDLQLLPTESHERVLELKVRGDIDMATVAPLREATRAAVASGDYDALIIDLLEVDFIDSSGLHVLSEADRAMVARGGSTRIVCADVHLLKVFELTGLDQVLSIVDRRDAAFAAAA
jgi:anti-sigma B factor antagonist